MKFALVTFLSLFVATSAFASGASRPSSTDTDTQEPAPAPTPTPSQPRKDRFEGTRYATLRDRYMGATVQPDVQYFQTTEEFVHAPKYTCAYLEPGNPDLVNTNVAVLRIRPPQDQGPAFPQDQFGKLLIVRTDGLSDEKDAGIAEKFWDNIVQKYLGNALQIDISWNGQTRYTLRQGGSLTYFEGKDSGDPLYGYCFSNGTNNPIK